MWGLSAKVSPPPTNGFGGMIRISHVEEAFCKSFLCSVLQIHESFHPQKPLLTTFCCVQPLTMFCCVQPLLTTFCCVQPLLTMFCCVQPHLTMFCCVQPLTTFCCVQPLVAIKVLAALIQTYEAIPSPSLQAHYHNALALKARLLSGCGVPAEVAECHLEPASELKAHSSSPASSAGRTRRALVSATLHAKLSLAGIKLSNDEVRVGIKLR